MAKVKFNAKRAANNLIKEINRVNGSDSLRDKIADFLVKRVQLQVRRGKPLNDTGTFPKLEASTVERRRKLAALNPTARSYRASKANLTFTGQLVDAITFDRRKKFFGGTVFELFVAPTPRIPYLGLKGDFIRAPNNRKLDRELRSGVGKKKKEFVMFTKKGLEQESKIIDRIRNIYVRFLRKALRKT